jgi:uncharacterized peroxidase-related enzyme
MEAHAVDLRAEVRELDPAERERFVQGIVADWRTVDLNPGDAALCAFADKLTRSPAEMTAADLQALRDAGLVEEAIAEAVQVISYFNYMNRVADALHVDTEADMAPYPGEAVLGAEKA